MPYSNGYSYRRTVTIDYTKVNGGSPLSDFPVLFSGTYAYLKTVANAGLCVSGNDIRFETAGGVQLKHEVEKYVATTGELIAWVQVPSVATSENTVFYIYYGKAGVTSEQDAANVWDANYQGVYHFGDGATLSPNDAKGAHNLAVENAAYSFAASGRIHGGVEFNGLQTVLYNPARAPLVASTTNWTMEAWFKPDVTTIQYAAIMSNGNDGSGYAIMLNFANLNVLLNNVAWLDTLVDVVAGGWYHVCVSRDTTTIRVYVNGVEQATTFATTPAMPVNEFTIGAEISSWSIRMFDGLIDEARISNVQRTAGWLITSFNSQDSPATFYSVGDAESSSVAIPHWSGGATESIETTW